MPDLGNVIIGIASLEECMDESGVQTLFAKGPRIAKEPFVTALGVWVACQESSPTVQQAAKAFRSTESVIREALEHHYWMFLEGETIELEGL